MGKRKSIEQRFKENPNNIQKAIDNSRKSEERYRSRIKQRVETMLTQPYCYFFTYTLSNESIELPQELHIKKIKATLPQATFYMINNDYGTQTERLHYHALASFIHEYDTTKLDKYQLGYTSVKPIKDKNAKSLYEYILKLSNHTTKRSVAKIWRSKKKSNKEG